MRVLHCYAGNLYGGVEVLLTTLARLRALTPMAPEFALCFEGRLSAELREAGVSVHDLGAARFSHPWTVLRAGRRLSHVIAERRPDVVVVHDSWTHAVCRPALGRRPHALWIHGHPCAHAWTLRAVRLWPPSLLIGCSEHVAVRAHRVLRRVPVRVVRPPVPAPPVDPGAREAVRAELGAGDRAVILMACRMTPYKGHGLLIAALARLRDQPGWTAWIAGAPQQAAEQAHWARVRRQLRAAGLADRVALLGQRRDVRRLIAGSDIHCQPNLGPEPFGIAFVEALWGGLPVVTTALGGAREIVTPDCGLVVPAGDPPALAAALRALIDPLGPRLRLGAAGPARAAALCEPARVMADLHAVLGGL